MAGAAARLVLLERADDDGGAVRRSRKTVDEPLGHRRRAAAAVAHRLQLVDEFGAAEELGHRAEGPEGVEAVLELLDGYELPAAAWEPEVLALRVKEYAPPWLDRLCFTGRIGWGRLVPPQNQKARAFTPLRSSPVSLFARENLVDWRELSAAKGPPELLPDTEQVL